VVQSSARRSPLRGSEKQSGANISHVLESRPPSKVTGPLAHLGTVRRRGVAAVHEVKKPVRETKPGIATEGKSHEGAG